MKQKILYIFYGNFNFLSRAKREIYTLLNNNYNVIGLNGYFNTKPEYQINFEVIKVKIGTTKYPIVNFFLLLKFNLSVYFYVKEEFSVVICRELSTLLAGVLIKYKYGSKLIYDSNELSVEQYTGLKKIIWTKIEKFCLKYCDYIIHTNIFRKELFKIKYKIKKEIFIIDNYSYYNQLCKPKEKDFSLIKLVYFGGIDKGRNIEDLVLAVKDIPNINLHLIGYCESSFKNYLLKIGGHNNKIKFLEPIDDSETNSKFVDYHIGIAFYPKTELNNWYCSPNKVWQYIQAGLSVITTKNPTLVSIIEKHNIGYCLEEITPLTLNKAINYIIDNKLWLNITDDIRKTYSWENLENKFLNIIKRL